ncbi:MAG: hypothetical protein LCH30_01505 [Proteobacteria bacterium]|nr:hypothetical protein [Pseudomonadota bacterium]
MLIENDYFNFAASILDSEESVSNQIEKLSQHRAVEIFKKYSIRSQILHIFNYFPESRNPAISEKAFFRLTHLLVVYLDQFELKDILTITNQLGKIAALDKFAMPNNLANMLLGRILASNLKLFEMGSFVTSLASLLSSTQKFSLDKKLFEALLETFLKEKEFAISSADEVISLLKYLYKISSYLGHSSKEKLSAVKTKLSHVFSSWGPTTAQKLKALDFGFEDENKASIPFSSIAEITGQLRAACLDSTPNINFVKTLQYTALAPLAPILARNSSPKMKLEATGYFLQRMGGVYLERAGSFFNEALYIPSMEEITNFLFSLTEPSQRVQKPEEIFKAKQRYIFYYLAIHAPSLQPAISILSFSAEPVSIELDKDNKAFIDLIVKINQLNQNVGNDEEERAEHYRQIARLAKRSNPYFRVYYRSLIERAKQLNPGLMDFDFAEIISRFSALKTHLLSMTTVAESRTLVWRFKPYTGEEAIALRLLQLDLDLLGNPNNDLALLEIGKIYKNLGQTTLAENSFHQARMIKFRNRVNQELFLVFQCQLDFFCSPNIQNKQSLKKALVQLQWSFNQLKDIEAKQLVPPRFFINQYPIYFCIKDKISHKHFLRSEVMAKFAVIYNNYYHTKPISLNDEMWAKAFIRFLKNPFVPQGKFLNAIEAIEPCTDTEKVFLIKFKTTFLKLIPEARQKYLDSLNGEKNCSPLKASILQAAFSSNKIEAFNKLLAKIMLNGSKGIADCMLSYQASLSGCKFKRPSFFSAATAMNLQPSSSMGNDDQHQSTPSN